MRTMQQGVKDGGKWTVIKKKKMKSRPHRDKTTTLQKNALFYKLYTKSQKVKTRWHY